MEHDWVATVTPAPAFPAVRYGGAISTALHERGAALRLALGQLAAQARPLGEVAACLVGTLRGGGKVLVAGNGGSAAEAQHFAAELVGRFRRERDPYAVLALTADGALLSAVANDYGYREVFARQVAAFGRPGDVLVAFSTSGESENLVRAAETARGLGVTTVAVTGGRPSRLSHRADLWVCVPSTDTPLTQEVHAVVVHLLCDVVEAELAGGDPASLLTASREGAGR